MADDMELMQIPGVKGMTFSAVKPSALGASEYTLVTITLDVSGSVAAFAIALLACLKAIIGACKKNPRSENLMIRLLLFNGTLHEIHGFKLLEDINVDDYDKIALLQNPDGFTALHDATFNSIGAAMTFADTLTAQDFAVNGANYIVTDGMNNRGTTTPKMIAELVRNSKKAETCSIESLITILVGVNTKEEVSPGVTVGDYLEKFQAEAELTKYVDIGDATPQRLAKLGGWVSQSISSQSQALGTGAPSQQLTF